MAGAAGLDHRVRPRYVAADSPDRADQLGHRVLGGHRVIEHRGIQCPPRLPRQRPGLGHHRLDRPKDSVGPIRGRQPPSPVGQRGGMKRPRGHRQPARGLPAQVKRHRIHGFAIGQPPQSLQRDHTGHHIGRHTGPASTRREQIGEHLIGEQLSPMRRQERKDAARLEKMTRYRLRIQ